MNAEEEVQRCPRLVNLDSTSGTTEPEEGGYSCRALEGHLNEEKIILLRSSSIGQNASSRQGIQCNLPTITFEGRI